MLLCRVLYVYLFVSFHIWAQGICDGSLLPLFRFSLRSLFVTKQCLPPGGRAPIEMALSCGPVRGTCYYYRGTCYY